MEILVFFKSKFETIHKPIITHFTEFKERFHRVTQRKTTI
jgi:hypothetical protein